MQHTTSMETTAGCVCIFHVHTIKYANYILPDVPPKKKEKTSQTNKQKNTVTFFVRSYTPILSCFRNLRKQNCRFYFCESCSLSFLYLKLSLAHSQLEGKGNRYI